MKMGGLRKAIYAGAAGLGGLTNYDLATSVYTEQSDRYKYVALGAGGYNTYTKGMDWAIFKNQWQYVGGVALVDYATSKTGIQRWFASRFR